MTCKRSVLGAAGLTCIATFVLACKGGRPAEQQAETAIDDATPADAQRASRPCGDVSDEVPDVWTWARTTLDTAIRANPTARVDDRIASAFHAATRRDAGLEVRVLDLVPARRAVAAAYECGALAAGGRLWLLAEQAAGRWAITDEVPMNDGEHVAFIMLAPDLFAVLGTRWETQARISTLRVVRPRGARWQVLFDRSQMVDVAIRGGGALRFAWAEPLGEFGASVGGPLRTFEGRVDPRAGTAIATPTSPWLEALDRWCRDGARGRRDRRLCSRDNVVKDVRIIGDSAAATLTGASTDVDCNGEAPASWFTADREAIIELSDDASLGWHVVDVRSEDRGCAIGRPPLAPSRAHVLRRRREHASDASVFLRDGHTYWLDDGALVEDRAVLAPLDADVASAALAEDGSLYWVAGWPRQLWQLPPGGAPTRVAALSNNVDGLVVEGDRPFWSSYTTGEIFTLAGNRPQVLVQGLDRPWGLAVQGAALLVATAGGIRRIDTRSGRVQDSGLPALSPVSIAVADGSVAWTEAGGRVMLAEPQKAARLLAIGGRPRAIAMEARTVVWTDASDGTIRRATF